MTPILVSQRLMEAPNYTEIREALDVEWGAFLYACGLVPIPVSAKVPVAAYFDSFNPAGILLTGGNDLGCCDPGNPLSKQRDRVERALIDAGIKHRLPVLGVCRGMQMLGFYFGTKPQKVQGHVASVHGIEVVEGTLFGQFYSKQEQVNSYHQYGFQNMTKGLKAAAYGTDNTLEAVEHSSLPIYGMMWHPERDRPFSRPALALVRHLFTNVPAQPQSLRRTRKAISKI